MIGTVLFLVKGKVSASGISSRQSVTSCSTLPSRIAVGNMHKDRGESIKF
jgi:hypothetical protein